MRFLALSLLIASIALSLCACGGGGPMSITPASNPVATGFDLTAPTDLALPQVEPRQASYTENDLVKLGSGFEAMLPNDNVVANSDKLEFHAAWSPGQGISGLAYCTYVFEISGYDRSPEINTTWSVPPQDTNSIYIGLANWNTNRWDWFSYESNPLTLSSFDDYLHGGDGLFLLTVAVIDSDTPTLDKVQLGPPPSITQWTHSWGGSEDDWANSIATNGTDAVYSAGYCNSFGVGGTDAVLAKYSLDGTFQWAHAWGGGGNENYKSVVVADDGQVYTAGLTESYGEGGYDLLVQGWSENGVLTWTRVWGTAADESIGGMAIRDGNLYIVCSTTLPTTDKGILLVKYDTGGNLLWAKSIGDQYDDTSGAICVTSGGVGVDNVHLAFNLGVSGDATDEAYCEIRGDGTLLLQKVWQYADYETYTRDIAANPEGTQLVISGYADNAAGGKSLLLLEYSAEPTYIERTWDLEADGYTTGDTLVFYGSGNMVVGGGLSGVGSFGAGFLATVSPDGTLLSANALTSSGGPAAIYGLTSLSADNLLYAGNCDASDNCSFTTTTLSSSDLDGTWADADLIFASFSGTASLSTGSTVTDVTTGVEDSGGGSSDLLAGMAQSP